MASVEAAKKTRRQITNRLASQWVGSVITVTFPIPSRRCVGKNRTPKNTSQNTRVINTKNQENAENSDEQNAYCIHYNEHYYSLYESSEDNHIVNLIYTSIGLAVFFQSS